MVQKSEQPKEVHGEARRVLSGACNKQLTKKKTTPHLEVSEPPKPYVSSLDSDSYMENLSVARTQKLLPVLRVEWRAH